MSSVFLFGAGASYGSGPCTRNAPPLGAQLFPALQSAGGVAAPVDADLADAFVPDFENGMDRFWAERNTQATALLRDMARFFAPFEPQPGNLYLELLRVLGGTRKKAVMVTTNYDLLIEHAVVQSGLLVTYGGLPAAKRILERAGWVFWRCFASTFLRRRKAMVDDVLRTLQERGVEPVGAEGAPRSVHTEQRRFRAAEGLLGEDTNR